MFYCILGGTDCYFLNIGGDTTPPKNAWLRPRLLDISNPIKTAVLRGDGVTLPVRRELRLKELLREGGGMTCHHTELLRFRLQQITPKNKQGIFRWWTSAQRNP